MSFDPLINYGVLDFSKEENLVYWNFSELLKTLITLGKEAGDQLEIMGTHNAATEMALDFDSFYTLSAPKYVKYKLLGFDQLDELAGLGQFLDSRNGDEDFWTPGHLYNSEDWISVRGKAAELLQMIGMSHLDIELSKETRMVENVGGVKEMTPVLQRLLVYK